MPKTALKPLKKLTKQQLLERKRERAAKAKAESRLLQDIGKIPKIKNPARRKKALGSFEYFCKTYFPLEFSKPWAQYHYDTAQAIEHTFEYGGWYARALPRGGGKTTMATKGVLWGALRGTHPYVVIIGARDEFGQSILQGIKTDLAANQMLMDDFPHVCHPIRHLGGETRSALGQRYKGERTYIEWGKGRIVFPWIDERGSLSKGGVIEAHGITSAFRGLKHTRPDGSSIRPSAALVDDPQTRESARSPAQTQARLETLTGDVAYLAGPGEPLPVFVPCTVIYEGDLADQILNRDTHPEWRGQRTKMVELFPTNVKLWDEYADKLRASLREGGDGREATEFYASNRKAMDRGGKVSWEHRHYKHEISALQHAMNFKIRDEAAFMAECQNEPITMQDDLDLMTVDDICKKMSGYKKNQIPADCSHITAFTDIQMQHMFYMIVAWTPDFTGYVVDYGGWPDQKRRYWTRREVRYTLANRYGGDESSQVYNGLQELQKRIMGSEVNRSGQRVWMTMDGREMPLSRWCIDANWRNREQAVKSFATQSKYSSVITLTYGRGVRATQQPMSQSQRALKWKTGPGWYWIDRPGAARGVTFDSNMWKRRIHDGLSLPVNARGSIHLWHGTPTNHRMLADHLVSEKPVRTEAEGRVVYEFLLKMNQDNEGLDSLVGCAVGASIAGVAKETERKPKRERRSLAEMKAKAQRLSRR